MARLLTDPLEPIPSLRPLRPAGAPGAQRRPRVIARMPQDEGEEAPREEEGSETYDEKGQAHHPQVHKVDLED